MNGERRGYQREVGRLLERIDAQTRELDRLRAAGARSGALERERERTRRRLAAVVGARRPMSSGARGRPSTVRDHHLEGAAA